jgi:hypothetical protein
MWHYNEKSGDFTEIPANNKLIYLELNLSNIHFFNGIDKFENLKRLELHYCTKLISDRGISKISESLEHLHINQSKKFIPMEELYALKNIRVLCLNSCGDLDNLNFLKYFPKLIDFRFVNTNVLDGDLTPIVEHPTIKSVGYLNKKHYNIKAEKMKLLLDEKSPNKYKVTIKNGEYSTFKYID